MLLNIVISGKKAVVIGGGKVAWRKIRSLLASGAQVSVVAPFILEEISTLAQTGRIQLRQGNYRAADLAGMFLVVAATDDSGVNRQVALDAGSQGIMTCVADDPQLGNCSFPALLCRGNLEIGVSTGGCCPALAAEIRDLVGLVITDEYGAVLDQLAKEREKLLTEGNPSTYNEQVLRPLARRLLAELTESKESSS